MISGVPAGEGGMEWAVIFDWDGVILDSSAAHETSWQQLAAEEGKPLPPDHFERGFGLRGDTIIREILEWTADPEEMHRLIRRKEILYRAVIRRTGIQLLPGVIAFLDALRDAGVPCGVGSSTPRANIDCAISMLKLDGRFQGIAAAEDVRRGKPEPDVFLEAARRLKVDPMRCAVVEDAPAGVEAARRAGMVSIGVTTTRHAKELSAADWVVDRLDAVQPEALRERIRGSLRR